MDEFEAVQSLSALAQNMRLRVFRSLVIAGPEGATPSQLSGLFEVPPATLSFHLKELVHAHLITQQRESRNLIYRANFTQMTALLDYLTQHCCQGEPCEVTQVSGKVSARSIGCKA